MFKYTFCIAHLFLFNSLLCSSTPKKYPIKNFEQLVHIKNFEELVHVVSDVKTARNSARSAQTSSNTTPHEQNSSHHSSREDQPLKK